MSQSVQVAKPDDAEEIFALLQRAYASLLEQDIHFTITQGNVSQVRQTIERETVLVLRKWQRAVATVTVRFPWTQPANAPSQLPFIHWFAVDPDFKGQGYGREIISWAEDHLLKETLKAPGVYLATAVKHPWLSELYQRRGYQPFYHRTNPLGEALVFLKKEFQPEVTTEIARSA
ncbi:MAG: GNAT family N-acetyltransferase [Pantoea sp.]|uniref:GNAT family N-acetyltransferase n=1 Tax=Pantoea TaxID=53335 RepID=UPI0028A962B4|nr:MULTISPECIES: GNAT family N-acetyltransferase [Pantoea]MDU1574731.1 GNAT family N-acetyltransferase [Pantoea sp.]MDU6079813.1 GNAT family N-acetyltransferase [Pantoea sp.]MDU7836812.1 GNAT family N-acetyltransferase [Pantoea sp.]